MQNGVGQGKGKKDKNTIESKKEKMKTKLMYTGKMGWREVRDKNQDLSYTGTILNVECDHKVYLNVPKKNSMKYTN